MRKNLELLHADPFILVIQGHEEKNANIAHNERPQERQLKDLLKPNGHYTRYTKLVTISLELIINCSFN